MIRHAVRIDRVVNAVKLQDEPLLHVGGRVAGLLEEKPNNRARLRHRRQLHDRARDVGGNRPDLRGMGPVRQRAAAVFGAPGDVQVTRRPRGSDGNRRVRPAQDRICHAPGHGVGRCADFGALEACRIDRRVARDLGPRELAVVEAYREHAKVATRITEDAEVRANRRGVRIEPAVLQVAAVRADRVALAVEPIAAIDEIARRTGAHARRERMDVGHRQRTRLVRPVAEPVLVLSRVITVADDGEAVR